ncbi:DEAD/DEAH box helicase [Calidifontibacter sp. DB0510]|uniref:DEAD/DEAH box helicase n=1 Tax=Metallococcus carri TaxID=1656884 RepID=A0A967B2M8_9MICO|nr:DEAD/DEAH box helicase [Metallococcus carri]NHN54522.1 DEAD/DEAH box helicase [Metallococcus carri]NOP36639.1 DEAD/DEAH box helicase [Calidifontibacter sp. DB2511S]
MTPKKDASGKKARWTRAQKQDAQRTRKPGRGADRSTTDAPRGPKQRWRDDPTKTDRTREDRSRSNERRYDDAPASGRRRFDAGDRPQARYVRDDRRPRFNDRDRDDRPRSNDRDRGERRYNRDDRPRYNDRDDRPRYNDRDRGERRDDRRPAYDRDRGERRYNRDDRPRYNDRDRGERRYNRDDRPRYNDRDRGERRYNRDDRPRFNDRGDRGERRYNRDDRPRYDDRRDRPRYNDRGDRPRYNDRDRGERRYNRDDRPRFNERDDRRSAFDSDAQEQTNEAFGWTERRDTEPVSNAPIDLSHNGFAQFGMPEPLVARLARDGITEPFPIQSAAIPDALAGRDVLGRGRTGSGKTLAFGLPTLSRLANGKAEPGRPRALVLVPTRELAMQVSDALQPLVHVLGLRHKLVAGGMPYEPQLSALAKGVDLLIATPGRLKDLIERGAADLSAVEVTILDEADHMAEMGFLEAITEILDLVPADGQRLLFSATLDRGIDKVVERYLTDPVEHATDDGTASVSTMAHHALLIEPRDKKVVTAEVANREGRTVVFVRTKLGADRIARELREQGVLAAALHGGLNQAQRNRALTAFREGRLPVLVATDVAARGIHVDDVGVVLQVDPPADHKDYLHRAGRTARAGEAGTVVTLALPHQRRTVQRLLTDAGVDTQLQKAQPGDDVIAAAGGRVPEGAPISDADLDGVLKVQQRRAGRPGGRRYGGQNGRPARHQGGRPRSAGDRRGYRAR